VTIPNQKDEPDPLTSVFCFIYHDTSDYQQSFFWVAGLIIFAAYVLLPLLSGLTARLIGFDKSWMDIARGWTSEQQRDYHRRYEMLRFSTLNKPWGVGEFELHPPAGTSPLDHPHIGLPHSVTPTLTTKPRYEHRLQQYVTIVILYVQFFVAWAFLRFFAIWAIGDEDSITIILALFGFAAWNTYDLIDYKLSNADLETEESDWGFGQVLPMVLLGLILLQNLDSIQGECPWIV
jgi:uncharacterized membrane protein (DUF485 family)